MKKVAVLILNWNGKKNTLSCLDSLKRVNKDFCKLSLTVVDNNSSDNSAQEIAKLQPQVNIISLGENKGFAGGNNVGIRAALNWGADYVWLLNNDTRVDKNALRLISIFENPRVGIAGSKIYFAPGFEFHRQRYKKNVQGKVFWYAGGIIDWANMYASHRGVDQVDIGQYNKPEITSFVTGCSMMIRRSVFEKIGMFDERYFLYFEDLDFCLRAKRSGFLLYYIPDSVVWHLNAGSSGGAGSPLSRYYLIRNRLLIGLRYAPYRTKFALLRELLKILKNGDLLEKKAVKDFMFGSFGKCKEIPYVKN